MKKYLIAALLTAIAATTNAGDITTRLLSTQQLVGIKESAVWDGKLGFTTTLSYVNIYNPTDNGFVVGADLGFAFVDDDPYVRPVSAHILGGWHKTWNSGIRIFGGAQMGVGQILLHQELSNQFFEEVKNQRQFTPTIGLLAAVGWQGAGLGINLLVSWDYNIFKVPETTAAGLTLDRQVCYRNPFSVGLQVSYALQNGLNRQDGDFSPRAGVGYTIGFGETPISRTIVRLGKTLRQSGKWSAEYGMQFEYGFGRGYTAACGTYGETFLFKGSQTRVRPFVEAKAGFCNVPVSSDSYAHSEQPGGTGDLSSSNHNMQPGFVLGGKVGVDIRLFGKSHLDIAVGYDRCWTSKPQTEGFDQSHVTNTPMNLWGATVTWKQTL